MHIRDFRWPFARRRILPVALGALAVTAVLFGLMIGLRPIVTSLNSTAVAADQVIQLPFSGASVLAASTNGSQLAVGSASGQVAVCDVTARGVRTLDRLTSKPITALAYAPTGFLFAGTDERTLIGWQAFGNTKDKTTREFPNFPADIACIAVHPTRFEVVVGLADGSVYSLTPEEPPKRFQSRHESSVKAIAFHPSGDQFVTAGADGRLIWRNAENLQLVDATRPLNAEIGGIAFSPDGTLLAAGDWNGSICVLDAKTRSPQFEIKQPDAVSGLVVTSRLLATASWDGNLRYWSLLDGTLAREVNTGRAIHSIAWEPDSEYIATVSLDAAVQLWRIPE